MRWWVLVVMLAPGAALADTGVQKLAEVISNAGHHATVLAAARASPVWVAEGCAGASFKGTPEVGVYLPLSFNGNGLPVAGEWREGLLASGCGPAVTLNVLTVVTGPGVLATGPLLPGGTIADPELQDAAQKYAVAGAGGVPAGCRGSYVADTVFGGYEGAVAPRPWREAWTLNFCGAVKTVVMHFAPDAAGTKITTGAVAAP
jgi:hypothetical protein